MIEKQPYYGRHNLPQKNKVSIAAKINLAYYYNLKKLGRSDECIHDMIQPERREQFFKDILTRYTPEEKPIQKKNWLQKLFQLER